MLEIPETSSQPIAPSPELKFQKLAVNKLSRNLILNCHFTIKLTLTLTVVQIHRQKKAGLKPIKK